MTDHAPGANRASLWRRRGIVALVVIVVLLAVRVGLDLWFGRQLSREVARLEKVYGSLDFRSMAPPRIPPAENRARVVRAAASLTNIGSGPWSADWQKLSAVVGAPPGQVNAALREAMARLIEQNGLALQVAAEIPNRSKSNWDIDYPEANRMPALMDIRGLSNVLAAASRADADSGRADAALQKASWGLEVAQSLAPEPMSLMQLVRIGIATDQLRAVQHALSTGEPAEERLAELARVLAECRTPDPIRMPLLGELKFANQMWARMEGGRSVEGFFPKAPSPVWASPAAWIFRPVIRGLRLRYLRGMDRLLELALVAPAARTQPIVTPARFARWWQFGARFDAAFLDGAQRIAEAGHRHVSQLNVAELAVALRRCRVATGVYPDSLEQLAPRYIARVPIDPFTGRAPEYVRQANGFTLTGHGPTVVSVADRALLEWKMTR